MKTATAAPAGVRQVVLLEEANGHDEEIGELVERLLVRGRGETVLVRRQVAAELQQELTGRLDADAASVAVDGLPEKLGISELPGFGLGGGVVLAIGRLQFTEDGLLKEGEIRFGGGLAACPVGRPADNREGEGREVRGVELAAGGGALQDFPGAYDQGIELV